MVLRSRECRLGVGGSGGGRWSEGAEQSRRGSQEGLSESGGVGTGVGMAPVGADLAGAAPAQIRQAAVAARAVAIPSGERGGGVGTGGRTG